MLKQIIGVISTRYLIALLNLVLILINAKVLGAEGMGTVGLIWAAVNINVAISSIFGGNTIVYFMAKYKIGLIYIISMLWIVVGSTLGCLAMNLIGILPSGYSVHIYVITLLYSASLANSRFLLGSDNIAGFNLTNLLQGGALFFALLFIYFKLDMQNVDGYVLGMYVTNAIALIASLTILLPNFGKAPAPTLNASSRTVVAEMFNYGLWSVTDNLAETFATRLNYFLVEHFLGRSFVGLLDAGTKISESIWHISRSVAYIEYNRIAKTAVSSEQKEISVKLLKYTFVALLGLTLCVMLIPEWAYIKYIFSAEFSGVKEIIMLLAPGIIMLGCNTILSHYFIGSGKIRYSAFASMTGLAVLLVSGLVLIPYFKIAGSALSSSIAFTAMFICSLLMFKKKSTPTSI